jgi:hypothetical protein
MGGDVYSIVVCSQSTEGQSNMCEVMDTRGTGIMMIEQEGCACVMVLCCVQSNFRE